MRRIKRVEVIIAMSLLSGLAAGLSAQPAAAETIVAPSLVLTQLKITSSNGQFVMLYNTTDTVLDMSKYQLEYLNSYDLTKATSSRLIALSGSLPPHGYYLVNDSQMSLCYQLVINSVSLGFSSTAGFIEILSVNQSSPGATANTTVQDFVGWSKTAAVGAQTLSSNVNASLLRQPLDSQNIPVINAAGSGSWLPVQPDSANQCGIVTIASPITKVVTSVAKLLPSVQPPVIILPAELTEVNNSINSGLMSPQINEILPNPNGSGNDATDEFIEIYNPNSSPFDLSGYGLEVGTTSLHNYIFPSGSSLSPQSFTAFYSAKTGLSLSNAGGQVKLLDPAANSISVSDVYGVAKDGQSWSLANSAWDWTTQLTPGTLNIVTQPHSVTATSQIPTTSATSSQVVKTSATPTSTLAKKSTSQIASSTPVHTWTLALVASAALLYGAYEYRADLGNRVYQFRKYLRYRRADWSKVTWWRSRRTNQ